MPNRLRVAAAMVQTGDVVAADAKDPEVEFACTVRADAEGESSAHVGGDEGTYGGVQRRHFGRRRCDGRWCRTPTVNALRMDAVTMVDTGTVHTQERGRDERAR